MPDEVESVIPALSGKEDCEMPESIDLSPNVTNVMLTRSIQAGQMVEADLIEVRKLLTYDHLENKRMVSMQQALGVREVQAKVTPGGPSQAKTE